MLDPDDLALLASSFEAAMVAEPDTAALDRVLVELGWLDLVAADPASGAAMAMGLAGATLAEPTLLDDVLLVALGLTPDGATAVVMPAPHASRAPGTLSGDVIVVDGLISRRCAWADHVLVPCASGSLTHLVEIDRPTLSVGHDEVLDSAGIVTRLRVADARVVRDLGPVHWPVATAAARVALAHQLIGASRTMLAMARGHAVDRVQFGRPIAGFQAVRHRLAESLVAIEGAAEVAAMAVETGDPLAAALAKQQAGKAARVTATHAQQVLAGIGFTAEHRFHLFLKRTMTLDPLFGSSRSLSAEIGRQLIEQRHAPRLVEL